MKYFFPKNYEYKEKILGIISYSTLFVHIIWILIIYTILRNMNINLIYKINIITILEFPLIIYTYLKADEEIIFSIIYVIKFLIKTKLYIYKK